MYKNLKKKLYILDDTDAGSSAIALSIFCTGKLNWFGLIFYPKWPSFELDLEIIKTNISSNILVDYLKKWPL